MIFNYSIPTDTVLPHVAYRDVEEAIAWLSRAFGFVEHYRHGDPVSGAQMSIENAWLMLKRARSEAASPKALGFGTQSLTIFIEDIEGHFAKAKSADVRIIEDLHETVYGELQYAAEDLDGHHWLFSRHARNLRPEQWGAAVSHPSVRAPQIAPMLGVNGGAAAIEFYKAAFGAEVLRRVDGEQGDVVAELSVGGARFWVTDESPEHMNFSPQSLGGSTVRLVVIVDDPDTVFARGLAAGAKEVWPVADQPYGWRVGRLVDPFGHHWEIGTRLSPAA